MNAKMTGCCVAALTAFVTTASDLYFSDANENNRWDNAAGWKANAGGTSGVVPTASDTITLNSSYLDVSVGKMPLTIPAGVTASCLTLGVGTLAQTDKRVLGLRLDGGSLTVSSTSGMDSRIFSIGDQANCFGLLDVVSGILKTKYVLVGASGTGTMTNRNGFICLDGSLARAYVGVYNGGVGRLVMTGGAFGGFTGGANDGPAVIIGYQGKGSFEMSGGTISNRLVVAAGTGGIGDAVLSGGSIRGRIDVGSGENARGTLRWTGGSILDELQVGTKGTGVVEIAGNSLSMSRDISIGTDVGGYGVVSNSRPFALYEERSLYAGIDGACHFHVGANLTIPIVKLSGGTDVKSTFTVYAGATNVVGTQLNVAGSLFPAAKGGRAANYYVPGLADYILKGGAIRFSKETESGVNFYIARTSPQFPKTFGTLRGYGAVLPAWSGVTNIRMAMGNGQIVADGEGEERTLDLNSVVSITNLVDYAAGTTNGWYAVNKGQVRFPRIWYGTDQVLTRTSGATPYATEPNFVNSVTFRVSTPQPSQREGNHYLRTTLLANDRTDAHLAELPTNDGVVGVWRLGIYDLLEGGNARGFGSIALTFHYDWTKVPDDRKVSLWRHENGGWRRVGRTLRQGSGAAYVSTSTALAPVADAANVGLFAVTLDKDAGLMVIVR